MNELPAASAYTACADLWCVIAYFNPAHYRTRRENYARCLAPLQAAGLPVLTVECAMGDRPFDLPSAPNVIQVRGPHVLWQKERLINLAVAQLPLTATKVAWLDGDILFDNPDWAIETARLLDDFPVVQPFSRAIRLHRNCLSAKGTEYAVDGFAATITRQPAALNAGAFHAHGHTGFAWAAQREWLTRHGLYDYFLSGNGDHYIAHALAGDLTSPCMQNLRQFSRLSELRLNASSQDWLDRLRSIVPTRWKQRVHHWPGIRRESPQIWQHFETWARAVAHATGRIGWVPGEVLHLWHGDDGANRGHGDGWLTMQQCGFDPATDVRVGPTGCLEWASNKPALHAWAQQFFQERQEDGVTER